MPALTENDPEIRDSTFYWFVLLEKALERGDLDEAARARRELDRLGVKVTHRGLRPQARRQEAGPCVKTRPSPPVCPSGSWPAVGAAEPVQCGR